MTISEVAAKYEISSDTLRYYERIGLIPRVTRSSAGIRQYSEEDCRWVEFAKCMRSAGLQIEVLIEYLSLFQQGPETADTRKALLAEQRNRLAKRIADMQETLARLDSKIENYDQILLPREEKLK